MYPMMVCLALYMGIQSYPPPRFEVRTELFSFSGKTAGWYIGHGIVRKHVAIITVDLPIVYAHEAAHHLQHMNGLPYDERQAQFAAQYWLAECKEDQ